MLETLHLENFVLFDRAAFAFAPGLNVISGETGAGKSLVAAALSQALGARALPEHIRHDADAAKLAAVFRIDSPALLRELRDAGLEPAQKTSISFERQLRRAGGGKLTVDGQPVPGAAARTAALSLVDFAAQHEVVRLADPSYQRDLLDRFGKLDALRAAWDAPRAEASALAARLAAGDAEKERVRLRAERLRDLLDRFDAFGFNPETDPSLEDRIRELAHAAAIADLAAHADAALVDDDEAVAVRLDRLRKELARFSDCSPALADALALVEEAASRLGDANRLVRHAADALEGGAANLDALITRAEAAKALAKRLGCEPAGLAERAAELRAELASLAAWDADEDTLRDELARRLPALRAAGLALSAKRADAAKKLAKAVGRELVDLEMPAASFQVRIDPLWTDADGLETLLEQSDAGGLDAVVFLLAANPGEAPARLSGETSGGETSRALLALKAALGSALRPAVLFLDEIDAGVGGRLGASLGRKLRALSRGRQIICITHLPQIAASADRHLKIAKQVKKGRTTAVVTTLDDAGRLEEIAQMIHGRAATGTTRRQAREMLEAAREGSV